MTQILPVLLAAAVLIGVPLMLVGSEEADERARSRTPSSSGSTIAGHAEAQRVSGPGVEERPAFTASPPLPVGADETTPRSVRAHRTQALVGVDAVPLSTSTGLDSPPSPQASVGAGPTGTPQPVPCVHRATALVGDGPAPSPTGFQGGHRAP